MVRLEVFVNEVLLTTVQGDGMLISTPTGSTAYNLSCGGSIVHADADVICLTPICPHSLSFRPVILPLSAQVKIVIAEESRTDAQVTYDGALKYTLKQKGVLNISESQSKVPFLKWRTEVGDQVWAQKLSKILKWNKQILQNPIAKL